MTSLRRRRSWPCRSPGREGVDVVGDAVALPFDASSFDVVVSTETFEHARQWRKIIVELQRVAKGGALIIVTAATLGRAVHGLDEYEFGHYKNVLTTALRATIRGKVMMFEEDYSAFVPRGSPQCCGKSATGQNPRLICWELGFW